ncbi:MAG: molybdenum cofactor biosynthesis protein MoaE [Acidobacteria bacterium]|nr:molybdenum cofactor biosynthesis protein MoaE [Acidobacteriota bacterium]
MKIVQTIITSEKIFIEQFRNAVSSPAAGAVVTFTGEVRDHDNGRAVRSLTYEVHPKAEVVLREIVESVIKLRDIEKVAVAHRFGLIPIGESAFIVAVSAAHRISAFKVCEEIVEKVKADLPIWKHQVFLDGTAEWVNSA